MGFPGKGLFRYLLTVRLGSLQLGSSLFLSPLAGYTNLPFRLVIREVGGVDLCTTDLVNARSLLERNRKALKLIETNASAASDLAELDIGTRSLKQTAAIIFALLANQRRVGSQRATAATNCC